MCIGGAWYEYTYIAYFDRTIFCVIFWNWIPSKYVIAYVLDYGDHLSNSLYMDYRAR
jgi:hypothetical protein